MSDWSPFGRGDGAWAGGPDHADPAPDPEMPGEPWASLRAYAKGSPLTATPVAPHPAVPHEFSTVCRLCGERGFLHVAVITDLEVVRVETRAALHSEETAP